MARKIMLLLTSFLLLISLITTASAAPKRIGISAFESNFTVHLANGHRYDIGTGAADMLATELSKNPNFQVIERAQLKSVLGEQVLGRTGVIDDATAAQKGKLLGLNYLVYGKIISAGSERKDTEAYGVKVSKTTVRVNISVRMIDTATAALVWGDTVEGVVDLPSLDTGSSSQTTSVTAEVYDQALKNAIQQITRKINEQSPTEGVVAQASGKKVYLDLGVDQGVQKGQIYLIYREGAPIMNRAGNIIGVESTDICTIRIISINGSMSIGEVISPEGAEVQPGDKARLN